MEWKRAVTVALAMLVLLAPSTSGQTTPAAATPTPTPAPAPAPEYVNLTELLSVAGPFSTFLDYLVSTKVIETFQNQANNTEEGVTIFVPKDSAFASLKAPLLKNLTSDQLKQLLLFHALPHYYSLSDFTELSQSSPVNTMAGGGGNAISFSDNSGTVHLNSGWTRTKVSSSVHSTDPVALYQVDAVLLPQAIFGTDIPPMPAPAPAPAASPTADSPASDSDGKSPAGSAPGKSGVNRMGARGYAAVALSGAVAAWLMML